jgi:hypothetical protein
MKLIRENDLRIINKDDRTQNEEIISINEAINPSNDLWNDYPTH